jgi:hypothetical protein
MSSYESDDLLIRIISLVWGCKVDTMPHIGQDGDSEVGVCHAGEERAGSIDLCLAVTQGRH